MVGNLGLSPGGYRKENMDRHRDTASHPAECAFITASPDSIEAAHGVGAQPIGYARTPSDREHLADAGVTCIIPSLADLTLRLRARPLPN
jgi:beta-phosphoglucomutase-like phosphatase (HAD superfamily)